jgi:hypothetical protein
VWRASPPAYILSASTPSLHHTKKHRHACICAGHTHALCTHVQAYKPCLSRPSSTRPAPQTAAPWDMQTRSAAGRQTLGKACGGPGDGGGQWLWEGASLWPHGRAPAGETLGQLNCDTLSIIRYTLISGTLKRISYSLS